MLGVGTAGCAGIHITEGHRTGILLQYLGDPHHGHIHNTYDTKGSTVLN